MRLHCLVPAVENAIAGNAFRPGDVLASRQGLSVEIGNTDAEGRLILADALTREELAQFLGDIRTIVSSNAARLPSHDEFIAANCAAQPAVAPAGAIA